MHWKENLLATISDRVHDAPLEIPYVSADRADYRPAKANGVFHHDLTFYVFASDLTTGIGGYHVLTPLQIDNGQWLLVDRGWIPYDKKGQGFDQPSGPVEVDGLMRLPQAASWLMPKNDPARGYWYSIDLGSMAASAKLDGFLPYILEADATPPGAYPIGGQTRLTLPNDHFSYAVTWYGFALILLIIYLLSGYHRENAD